MRVCQIAQGDWLPTMDTATVRTGPPTILGNIPGPRSGGLLPEAVFDFVHHWMNSEVLRKDDALHTIPARLAAIKQASESQVPLAHKRFMEFVSAAIYPPALYIPQIIGVGIARLFSDKVYLWFYSARIFNALCAVFLVFLALRAAPQYQLLLMLPAVLPMSLYEMGSVSSDASIVALSVLFVALCIRFWTTDSVSIRFGLVLCLFLLVMGKPVHLALGLLLLSAYKRLGWRRAISFCSFTMGVAIVSYLYWSYLVRRFLPLAGEAHDQDPAAQVRFIAGHPLSLLKVLLATLIRHRRSMALKLIGIFGWLNMPLPPWFYAFTIGVAVIILFIILLNWKKVNLFNCILGSLSLIGVACSVMVAGYIMWNRPGAPDVAAIPGRYFLPVLPIIAFMTPPFIRFGRFSRMLLVASSLAFLLISEYTTLRIVYHYYFPQSAVVGKNIHALFKESSSQTCQASSDYHLDSLLGLAFVDVGRTAVKGNFRVLFATDDGTILSESDPALMGADFPYVLLPGSSRSRWLVHVWYPDKDATGRFWLVVGGSACAFGPTIKFEPLVMPDA